MRASLRALSKSSMMISTSTKNFIQPCMKKINGVADGRFYSRHSLEPVFRLKCSMTVGRSREIFHGKKFGQCANISGLVGLIWQVREDLAFDVGLRHAITNARPVDELRAGLTFAFPAWRNGAARH